MQDYLDRIAALLGGRARLNTVPFETFAKFPFPGAEELAHMLEWFNQYGYFGPNADLELARTLAPKLQRFDSWLQKNKEAFNPK